MRPVFSFVKSQRAASSPSSTLPTSNLPWMFSSASTPLLPPYTRRFPETGSMSALTSSRRTRLELVSVGESAQILSLCVTDNLAVPQEPDDRSPPPAKRSPPQPPTLQIQSCDLSLAGRMAIKLLCKSTEARCDISGCSQVGYSWKTKEVNPVLRTCTPESCI